jgi:hypothetical protein
MTDCGAAAVQGRLSSRACPKICECVAGDALASWALVNGTFSSDATWRSPLPVQRVAAVGSFVIVAGMCLHL